MRRRWLEALAIALVPMQALASFEQERPETWEMPPSREQAERDPTLIPAGKGAIFIPSMSDPAREPACIVMREGTIVATTQPGRLVVLDPGIYEVKLGSGAIADRFTRKVLVKDGRTTVIPATWATVVINVVDERSEPFRGTYELVRLPEGRNLGVGLGADVELGEEVRAWVLEPGTYMVIKAGESFKARRDFYTFRALPGELLKLVVVMSREDGSLLGAGQTALGGFETAVKDWRLHFVVGADAELNRRTNMESSGLPSGIGFSAGMYLDFLAQYRPEKHLVYLRLRSEEGIVQVAKQPWQKDRDELKLDALYIYRLLQWLGPYVRFGYKSAIFPGYYSFTGEKGFVKVEADGTQTDLGRYTDRFRLSDWVSPIELKGGVGISLLGVVSYVLDANLRVGFGARALFKRGLLGVVGTSDDGRVRVATSTDDYNYGLETTAVATLRLTRWVLATTEFDMLETVKDPKHPIISWENNIALRLVSFLSLNYIFKLRYDRDIPPGDLQTEHRVLMRFTWEIL